MVTSEAVFIVAISALTCLVLALVHSLQRETLQRQKAELNYQALWEAAIGSGVMLQRGVEKKGIVVGFPARTDANFGSLVGTEVCVVCLKAKQLYGTYNKKADLESFRWVQRELGWACPECAAPVKAG